MDNKVYAFNAQTGAEIWSYTTGGHRNFISRGRGRQSLRGLLRP